MGSSIKINSISIDLAGAANEIDMVKCDHFSIRGYVAETRERDHKKCWPFPEESAILVDQESYSLPSLSVPKSRWWRCMSCIRDINADETKDCGLHPNSRGLCGKKRYISGSKLNSLTINDQEKERRTDDITGNAVQEFEEGNCKRSQKNDQRATTTVRNKAKKLASQEQGRNKRAKATDINSWKEKHNVGVQAVTTFGSSDIAGLVEDTPPKATKNHRDSLVLTQCDNGSSESINLAMTGLQRRKTRKVRRLSELLDQPETKTSGGTSDNNIRKEEPSSSKRGRKRKVLPENNYVSRKLITVGAASDQDYSTSSDSGFERDLIKGKQKNRRFQVVDEFVPSVLPCETSQKIDADHLLSKSTALSVPCPLSAQRTEKKLSLSRKKKHKPVSDTGKSSTLISFSSQYTDDRLASEGYIRKRIPQVNDTRPVISLHVPENNDHVRSRDAEANRLGEFGSSSKSNTGGWLRPGVENAVDFSRNNNLIDRSSVLQKDASGADRKGKTVMFQEHHEEPKRQSHDRNENTPEDQNDDIPMEIVELLAKNQYERCLPDKEEDVTNNNKQTSQDTTHKPKNTLLIDLNETYDSGASLEDNNTSSRPPKPFESVNARREEQQHIKSLDFFPISQPYVPSPFGIFPPPQENRASSIRFSGHTCQWLGNVPTMSTQPPYRVLRPCNTCQSGPHQYREAASHPIWASSMRPPPPPQCHHHTPVSFNMDPSTKLGMLPQPPPRNDNTWNLNFVSAAANGKQKCGPSTSEFSFGCKHGGGVNNSRPVEAFSSDSSIPALHLLSLMDPRVGPNSTPSDHQGNTNATKRHFPLVNQQPKERVEIQTGDSSKTAAYPTKQSPYDYYNKSFPIGPPLGASSFSFQNAQAPWVHHQENKTKRKEPDQGRFQLLGASDSMKLPLKFHMMDKERKQNRKAESCSNNASAWPPKNSCGPIVCSVSRNPADFTIAEPGNVYMLTGESLKVRKRAIYKKKPSLSKQDALNQTMKAVRPVTENV
ncbi:protein EMBRYONIC FLOWER 1 [Raphanus sativus]|uniref:Protein EMBRYONIC FLOWER 1 n=1 Tax=Raphanus sativus TaxID=3726 RepID=A0A6J0MHS9_RAPSA|nr:protein EMBRYONIC FLOWER 1 [Raphanus sativus]